MQEFIIKPLQKVAQLVVQRDWTREDFAKNIDPRSQGQLPYNEYKEKMVRKESDFELNEQDANEIFK